MKNQMMRLAKLLKSQRPKLDQRQQHRLPPYILRRSQYQIRAYFTPNREGLKMRSQELIAMRVMMWLEQSLEHQVMHQEAQKSCGKPMIVRRKIGSSFWFLVSIPKHVYFPSPPSWIVFVCSYRDCCVLGMTTQSIIPSSKYA